MKLSEILFKDTKKIWDEACEKDFVIQMAKGTLSTERFRNYMIQDYLYLKEYIEILNATKELSDTEEMTSFISRIITGTQNELYRVHIPNMKKIGITDEELSASHMKEVISDYAAYMKSCLKEYGLFASFSALLQCSWVYAYISENDMKKYADDICKSPYKDWFEAYTGQSYIEVNEKWIELTDKISEGKSEIEIETVKEIFKKCAEFENKFWDSL